MIEQSINIDRMEQAVALFGSFDENIKMLEQEYHVDIISRGSELKVAGEAEGVSRACRVIESLLNLINRGEALNEQSIRYCMTLVNEGSEEKIESLAGDCVCITAKGKPVKPKTLGQKNYVTQIKDNTITIGIGPAGTGKTYLAVAMAVTAFRAHQVNRIILTRPAVEAGEKLGFLPGDLQSKVDPYLRPLYDALFDMLGAETYQRYVERGNIEVAPLAYMRGRTLDDSFIILDEAQNTTREQMKMFLTLGDIVICMARAYQQAKLYDHAFQREVGYLTAHSMLHLLGYDHVQGGIEAVRMREKEEHIMELLGLPDSMPFEE